MADCCSFLLACILVVLGLIIMQIRETPHTYEESKEHHMIRLWLQYCEDMMTDHHLCLSECERNEVTCVFGHIMEYDVWKRTYGT
jgi:hypothetical protein